MAGWELRNGSITEYALSEDRMWSLFNFAFSESSRKRNTYKFGLIKALLDNVFEGHVERDGIYFSYYSLFRRFACNYWNLVVKYELRQMRPDAKSQYSKVEQLIKMVIADNPVAALLEYESLDVKVKEELERQITKECKNCVVGALYDDFEGTIYSFDLKDDGLILNLCFYEFMIKHKFELEKLNYYAWAKWLEKNNDDNVLIKVIDKLELATPKRSDLSIYRDILRNEFEVNTCFYCGKKISTKSHVDHFIPWDFVKEDKMWNFVLSCSDCNLRKNKRVPVRSYLIKLQERNDAICVAKNAIVQVDFEGYSADLVDRVWSYAKQSGIREFRG